MFMVGHIRDERSKQGQAKVQARAKKSMEYL